MTTDATAVATLPPEPPSFREAVRFWAKLGFISFGGPAGQIAIMQTELVEKRRWISQDRFLHALNYCMFLPGPEAQQLAIYIGWLLHKTRGGIAAGVLFVLPSMVILWALSVVYVTWGTVPWVSALFHGLKAAVLAVVLIAVIRIGQKALKNRVMWSLALAAFVAIFIFGVPFPLIVLAAALVGLVGGYVRRDMFLVVGGHGDNSGQDAVLGDAAAHAHTPPSIGRAVRVLTVCLLLWWAPIAAIALWLGPEHTLVKEGVFFSKAAMVTFGGAYAVLPYVSQQAVEHYGWLKPTQMMDGLGLAETTPGPLIMVLQFVGFLGAWNAPGGLPPLVAATLGALVTTWATFVPCFLWIFLGAPHIEQLRGNERLTTALSAVTAAVVGVVLNLAVWFGGHVLFPADGVDWFTLLVSVGTFVGMWRLNWGMIPVIAASAGLGLAYELFTRSLSP